jgi:hypothetical protein
MSFDRVAADSKLARRTFKRRTKGEPDLKAVLEDGVLEQQHLALFGGCSPRKFVDNEVHGRVTS